MSLSISLKFINCNIQCIYQRSFYYGLYNYFKMADIGENQIDLQTTQNLQNQSLCYNRHFGMTVPIGIRQDGQPKYVLGPHYILFMATLLISSIVFIIIGYNLASSSKNKKTQIVLQLIITMIFYIYAYIKVGFSNPGIASSYRELNEQQKNNTRYCVPCKIVRPLGTVHCYSCDVCIHGYDHHCPWVGKCIGRQNLCSFKLFLFSTLLAIGTFAYNAFTIDVQQSGSQNNN